MVYIQKRLRLKNKTRSLICIGGSFKQIAKRLNRHPSTIAH
ncbi:MAG: helix-turn-helix domain-containing protein [Candidatus Alectryocaccobium sp.]|nr:helix-turn-helix domain-containing protein [Candidatus Alectryocaccobium sp.]